MPGFCGPTVYVIGASEGPLKIGIAKHDVWNRLRELQVGNPRRLAVIMAIAADSFWQAREIEREVHKSLSDSRVLGEWFDVDVRGAGLALDRAFLLSRENELPSLMARVAALEAEKASLLRRLAAVSGEGKG